MCIWYTYIHTIMMFCICCLQIKFALVPILYRNEGYVFEVKPHILTVHFFCWFQPWDTTELYVADMAESGEGLVEGSAKLVSRL